MTEKIEGSHPNEQPEGISNAALREYSATLEAILFVHGSPIAMLRLSEVLDVSTKDAQNIVEFLADLYDQSGSGLQIVVFEKKVQTVTRKEHARVIEDFTKKQLEGPLSQAALEVLAVVAYRGPLSKPDIEAVRGVNCSFTLRNLSLRGLIEKIPHPTDSRTQLYRVTIDFVRHVGIDSVQELPHFADLAGDRRIDAVLYGEQSEEDEKNES